MKASINDIINSQQVLLELYKKAVNINLSLALHRLLVQVELALTDFAKVEAQMYASFDVQQKEDGSWDIPDDKYPEVNKEFQKMISDVVSLECEYLSLSMFPRDEQGNFTTIIAPEVIGKLDFAFEPYRPPMKENPGPVAVPDKKAG